MESTKKPALKRGKGRPPKEPRPVDGFDFSTLEGYRAALLHELSGASADLARCTLLKMLGDLHGHHAPDEKPDLRGSGSKLPSERAELLWCRDRILRKIQAGNAGATMIEALRGIRTRLFELDKEVPLTPEEVTEALKADLPLWPVAHIEMAIDEAIKRGLLQA